jgi:molybdenum cofactor cytidylyltransferase
MDNCQNIAFPIAGVVLAAGAAARMGQPKLLLLWNGETLIHRAARIALEAGLQPVVVVTGAWAVEMQTALTGLTIQVRHNPDWEVGQSTSVRAGIGALPDQTEAVVFMLGDQPYVSSELIQALVKTYTQNRPVILAPFVGEKRTNPVLFDRSMFNALCHLQGDAGARSLFGQYPPTSMPWPDEKLFLDIDTPEDYRKLIG